MNELHEHAQAFAEFLFAQHPSWRQFVIAPPKAGSTNVLVVRIPAPEPGRPSLEIEADDEEITVFYDRWHNHYGHWLYPSRADAFRAALEAVEGILGETLVVAVDEEGPTWVRSTLSAPGSLESLTAGRTRRVTSWRGSLDATESAV